LRTIDYEDGAPAFQLIEVDKNLAIKYFKKMKRMK